MKDGPLHAARSASQTAFAASETILRMAPFLLTLDTNPSSPLRTTQLTTFKVARWATFTRCQTLALSALLIRSGVSLMSGSKRPASSLTIRCIPSLPARWPLGLARFENVNQATDRSVEGLNLKEMLGMAEIFVGVRAQPDRQRFSPASRFSPSIHIQHRCRGSREDQACPAHMCP